MGSCTYRCLCLWCWHSRHLFRVVSDLLMSSLRLSPFVRVSEERSKLARSIKDSLQQEQDTCFYKCSVRKNRLQAASLLFPSLMMPALSKWAQKLQIAMFLVYNIDVIFLLIFKFASHWTIACIVSTANKPLVGTLMTISYVTRNIAIHLHCSLCWWKRQIQLMITAWI